jgi:uracil phosphoribosyltransferase
VKEKGAKNIKFVCIIAAPEGVKVLQDDHPDVDIIAARLDRELNSHAYILPGLGDAGDRIYGTK